MDTTIYIGGLLTIVGLVVGCYVWCSRHINNRKKHPCADDLVYKGVCESERRRLEDCMENGLKNVDMRLSELKSDVKDGFKEVKELIAR